MARDFRTVIDKFLGLHQSEQGEGRLKRGESPRMKNLTVTPSYSLIQRNGWRCVSNTRGVGRAVFGDREVIWVVDDRVYLRLENGTVYEIGTLDTAEGQVSIFPFNSKIYFLDGKQIKVWDGESFKNLQAYVPLVAVSCDYLGAGTPFEDVNILTGTKRQTFSPDGIHGCFQLIEKDIERVDSVKLSGEVVSPAEYNVDTVKGTVEFASVPEARDANCLEITFTKANTDPDSVHRMRYAVAYGGGNDTVVFLWGDRENPSFIRYSGVHDGISELEYFPELNFNKIGDGARVTSAVTQYDSLLVFTDNGAYQCSEENTFDVSGMGRKQYPVKTVSTQVGCEAEGFATLVDNLPVTLCASGLYRWRSSSIRDEKNAEEIGERIRCGLKEFGVEGVHCFDKAGESELFIWKGDKTYVYNYALDLFYYYEGFDAAAFDCDRSGNVWFVRADGRLCTVTDERLDDGKAISFFWDTGYEEHSGLDTKNVHRLEFELFPISSTSFGFVWVSERLTGRHETLEIKYNVSDFSNTDFTAFTFATATTPVRLHKRIKTKRTRGFKLMIENDGDRGDFHLLSLAVVGRISDTQ